MASINLNNDISVLSLSSSIVSKLNDNNIFCINDLWQNNRKSLKDMCFSDRDINDIIIKLQLNGIDLNKRIY